MKRADSEEHFCLLMFWLFVVLCVVTRDTVYLACAQPWLVGRFILHHIEGTTEQTDRQSGK